MNIILDNLFDNSVNFEMKEVKCFVKKLAIKFLSNYYLEEIN